MLWLILPALASEPPTASALAEYRAEKLTVQRYVRAGSGAHLKSEYYQGETRLWGSKVYEILGHPELIQKYHRRNAANVGFVLGGAAAFLGGCALQLSNHVVFGDEDMAIGGGLMAVGAVSVGVVFLNRPDRGDWYQEGGWIESYNVALAERLGVPLTVTAP